MTTEFQYDRKELLVYIIVGVIKFSTPLQRSYTRRRRPICDQISLSFDEDYYLRIYVTDSVESELFECFRIEDVLMVNMSNKTLRFDIHKSHLMGGSLRIDFKNERH